MVSERSPARKAFSLSVTTIQASAVLGHRLEEGPLAFSSHFLRLPSYTCAKLHTVSEMENMPHRAFEDD